MTRALSTVDGLLLPILAQLRAIDPTEIPARAALGMLLVSDLVAPAAVPARATALRAGFAVTSLDIAGASMHAPAVLMHAPRLVTAGDPLPEGCDAVVDVEAVARTGTIWEIAESVEPGRHVRLAGHDLAARAVIAHAGSRVTAEVTLAAELAGLKTLAVRRPSIALQGFAELESAWLLARLRAFGLGPTGDGAPQVIIRAVAETLPRLALRPCETAWMRQDSASIIIEVPTRFDGIVAAWCALILPVLAKLLDRPLEGVQAQLTRKVTSTVGFAEVALFRRIGGDAIPLAVGDLPLSAVAMADAYCIVPSDLEGYPQGAQISLISLAQPFTTMPRS